MCVCVWQVVCQACSTNKYYLEYLKNQPARVCDQCFEKLQENSEWFPQNQAAIKKKVISNKYF